MSHQKCEACKREIRGEPITWLGEDYRDEGGGWHVYAFHHHCSLAPWPLFEVPEDEAKAWIAFGATSNYEPSSSV
jgi:hypothetical protein